MRPRILIVGSSGFVGGALRHAVESRGWTALTLKTPRLTLPPNTSTLVRLHESERLGTLISDEVQAGHPDVVVNAGGVSDAKHAPDASLEGANALLPGVLYMASQGTPFIHVSSAAVQGTKRTLDDSPTHRPESHYGAAKARGEQLLIELMSKHDNPLIIFRPPGVHSHDRAVTRTLARLARSRAAVTSAIEMNSPQALLENVVDALCFVVEHLPFSPTIVHYPSEGITNQYLLRALGGREPQLIPDWLACTLVGAADAVPSRALKPHVSRLRLLLRGQHQAPSWLTTAGWQAPRRAEAWHTLGIMARRGAARMEKPA